jgi:predicted metal-dependent phosphoesterase TrpH
MIDLQMHSCFSDGSMTPSQLVQQAKQLGLYAISLTDHDTIDGIPEFLQAGKELNILTIPGVEISVDTKLPRNGHMHMLGLFLDHQDPNLKSKLDYLRSHRNERAEKILYKLKELGAEVSLEELQKEAGEGSIGRPHIAKILLRKGIVSTLQEAFDVYLAKGKPAYVDKVKFDEENAISLIKKAGGLAVLAHPHFMNYHNFEETSDKIVQLKDMGLDGFEVYYSGLEKTFTQKLIKLAQEHDFVISGGSDYHGINKDNIKMGTGKNDLKIPDEIYYNLKEKWESTKKLMRVT